MPGSYVIYCHYGDVGPYSKTITYDGGSVLVPFYFNCEPPTGSGGYGAVDIRIYYGTGAYTDAEVWIDCPNGTVLSLGCVARKVVSGLAPGDYVVHAEKDGDLRHKTVHVSAGAITIVEFDFKQPATWLAPEVMLDPVALSALVALITAGIVFVKHKRR